MASHFPPLHEQPPPSSMSPPTLTEVIDETEADAVLADAETSPLSEFLETNDGSSSPEALKSLLQQKLDLGEDKEPREVEGEERQIGSCGSRRRDFEKTKVLCDVFLTLIPFLIVCLIITLFFLFNSIILLL